MAFRRDRKKVAFAERRFDCKIYGRSFLSFTRFPKHLNLCVFTKFHMRSYKTCVLFFLFFFCWSIISIYIFQFVYRFLQLSLFCRPSAVSREPRTWRHLNGKSFTTWESFTSQCNSILTSSKTTSHAVLEETMPRTAHLEKYNRPLFKCVTYNLVSIFLSLYFANCYYFLVFIISIHREVLLWDFFPFEYYLLHWKKITQDIVRKLLRVISN